MKKISAVIFDLGRVLVDIDFNAFPNALELRTPEERAPYAEQAAAAGHLYELGRLTTEEFLDRLFLLFKERFTRERLLFAWNEIIRQDVPGMASIVERVQQSGHATAMLSNTSRSHFEKAERDCLTVQRVKRRFLSYEIGTAKPSPEIYRHVITSLRLEPEEILFIDDLKENIDGARSAGIQGVIFSGVAQLERELVQWNILPPPLP
jgi:glucose-1-phosphatase